ncbi:MAG: hypothetical protein H6985_00260 [Pseudomonadales bacterium]|nr:hypothetical protein [Halioglobus sp.]MCP5127992.1 hypothetical protein [Pseudomonadales bacterium]
MKHRPDREDNFIWLLTALVFLLFFGALFTQLELSGARLIVNVSLIFTVITAVWSLHPAQHKWFIPKLFITTIIVALMVVDTIIEGDVLALAQLSTMFLFLSITLYIAWDEVMFKGQITRNTIFGAICIYILIGLLFGFAYLIVAHFSPGSMSGLAGRGWHQDLQPIIYYSMVTLTTTGYGDITPMAPLTRFLAYTEALIGIFYTTVLVASLIGMRLTEYRPDKPG